MVKTITWLLYLFLFCVGIIVFSILNSLFIDYITNDKVFFTVEESPAHTIGLVFGTSKMNNLGTLNRFFLYRIQQTVALYKAGKIKYILISGDNRKESYDEPTSFKDELIKKWIPSDRIVLDYAGLSTWDSVARAQSIFAVKDLLLISQDFQIQRGIIACWYHDIICHGSATDSISFRIAPRVYLREYGARIKLWYDMLTPAPDIGGKVEEVPW